MEGVAWLLLVCSKMQEETEAKETTVKYERGRAGFANKIVIVSLSGWQRGEHEEGLWTEIRAR